MATRHEISKEELAEKQKLIDHFVTGFDLLDDHVIVTDLNGNILYANLAVEKHTGYKRDEIMGKNPADLWGGQMEPVQAAALWDSVKRQQKPWKGEVHNRHKDGTMFWQELHVTPVLDADAKAAYFIGIEPDISIRKAAEDLRSKTLAMLTHKAMRALELEHEMRKIKELTDR